MNENYRGENELTPSTNLFSFCSDFLKGAWQNSTTNLQLMLLVGNQTRSRLLVQILKVFSNESRCSSKPNQLRHKCSFSKIQRGIRHFESRKHRVINRKLCFHQQVKKLGSMSLKSIQSNINRPLSDNLTNRS